LLLELQLAKRAALVAKQPWSDAACVEQVSHVARQRTYDVVGVEVLHANGALDQRCLISLIQICSASDLWWEVRIPPDVWITFFKAIKNVSTDLDAVGFELPLL